MEKPTPVPHDSDSFAEMASTRILPDDAVGPANETELTPSRVLGKNLVVLGDYQLKKKLGEGAMGAVYLATQISFDRQVALKILFPHIANNPKLVERLYREGRVMGQLDHPNIVQAYGIGEDHGCHFVAMEYVDGLSMQKWLAQLGRVSVEDAVTITLRSLEALGYAHANVLVHRDIKPDNILVTFQGQVKIADLGMVKTNDEDMSLTQTGHAVGTPWYMPLEQARNAKDIDGRSDIYALGCSLYCFLTGRPPFTGRTIVDVIQAKEVGTFPPARQSNPDVPERLDLIIAKMTAKHPKNRYQSCAEVIEDLKRLHLDRRSLSFIVRKAKTVVEKKTSNDTSLAIGPGSETNVQEGRPSSIEITPHTVWHVRVRGADGKKKRKTYTTTQLFKLIEDGTIDPSAKASLDPETGYRVIATYKEFQGAALARASRKANAKNDQRYQKIYSNFEEKDRERDAQEKEATQKYLERQFWIELWANHSLLISIVGGILGLIVVLFIIGRLIR